MDGVTSARSQPSSNVASLSLTLPAGSDGDLLLAYVLEIGVGTGTAPTVVQSGWTTGPVSGQNAVTTNRLRSYWKERDGDTTVQFNLGASRRAGLIVLNVPTEKRVSGVIGTPLLGGHGVAGFGGISATTAPGTPSFQVSNNNPTKHSLDIAVWWNAAPSASFSVAETNSYQPGEPPGDMAWSEINRIDADGLNVVQVMASHIDAANMNNYTVTRSGTATTFGSILAVLYDDPQTALRAGTGTEAPGIGSATTTNGVQQAIVGTIETQEWASEVGETIHLDAGGYDVEVRQQWNGTLSGSTRYAAIKVDGQVIASDTITLGASLSPLIYLYESFTLTEPGILEVEVGQGGDGTARSYRGGLAIWRTTPLTRWRVGSIGF